MSRNSANRQLTVVLVHGGFVDGQSKPCCSYSQLSVSRR